ncbi:Mpv17/PMP [Parasponia andersonii]|uniref:Mpv17/PMP n=1 Tax=Parasponia andersonii TaxID=3476 RepID=A0A2P5E561_PARAD|nr:Mpv17/PMP [Parasponia andersonii]
MAANSAPLARKFPLLSRFVGFSRKPISPSCDPTRIPAVPAQIREFRSYSLCHSYVKKPLSFSHGDSLETGFSCFRIGLGQLGCDGFRVSVVADGGSGGAGRYGGSGDGNYGGGGGEGSGSEGGGGGESNWSLLSWYLGLLAKYPVTTKAVTSALLTLVGDLICQIAIDQVPSLDLKRMFLFTLLGLAYLYLSKLVTLPGGSGAFLRLLLDQFLFSPIFIGVFLSTLVTLEGRPEQVIPKLQQEWFSAVLANWQLWIPFQFLNFRFVPQQFQVLAANFIALIWNVILSFKAHKEILPKKV